MFGRLELTFREGELEEFMQAKSQEEKDWRHDSPYHVVANKGMKIIVSSVDALSHKPTTTVVNFESRNRFWIDLEKWGGREYFDRVIE